MSTDDTTMQRPVESLPTEMGTKHAVRNYLWRLMGFVFTFAPLSAMYVVALVILNYRQHSSPKTAVALALVTLIAVVSACFATGVLLKNAVGAMPHEVRWVLKPLIALGIAISAIAAVPVLVVADFFH